MKKKIISVGIILIMLFSACPTVFANSNTIGDINIDNDLDRSSHEKMVKELVDSSSGTEYSVDGTKKANWHEDHYKVYYENIATGVRRFEYHQYEWSWAGYKKQEGRWVYDKSSSGTNREHLDPKSFIEGFL